MKASVLWCSTLFMIQLLHPYVTMGKTIALIIGVSLVAQVVKNPPANARDLGLTTGLGRSLGEENGNSFQYSWSENPRESHGQRSLVSYSPWGCKKSDTTERLRMHLCTFVDRPLKTLLIKAISQLESPPSPPLEFQSHEIKVYLLFGKGCLLVLLEV